MKGSRSLEGAVLGAMAVVLCWLPMGCGRTAAPASMQQVLREFVAPGGRTARVERIAMHRGGAEEVVTVDLGRVDATLHALRALPGAPAVDARVKWVCDGDLLLTRSDGAELEMRLVAVDGRCVLECDGAFFSSDRSFDDWCSAVRGP